MKEVYPYPVTDFGRKGLFYNYVKVMIWSIKKQKHIEREYQISDQQLKMLTSIFRLSSHSTINELLKTYFPSMYKMTTR